MATNDKATVRRGERGGYVRTMRPGSSVLIGGIRVTVLATGKAVKGNGQENDGHHDSNNRRKKRGGNRIRLLFSDLPEGTRVTPVNDGGAKPVPEAKLPADGDAGQEDGQPPQRPNQQDRRIKPRYAHRGPLQLLL